MIRQKVRAVRTTANLVARSIDAGPQSKQNELDILEMLRVTENVIKSRLAAGIYDERQKDKKRKYSALFRSVHEQVLVTIRKVFANEDGRASGLVLQKYNTLVLDALFDLLKDIGPENAIRVTSMIVRAIRRDILTLGETNEVDAMVAGATLAEMSKERARSARRPMTKAQRLAAIDRAVRRISEVLESETES